MANPQVIEAARGPLFQVAETGANATAGIDGQHVPAMFVDAYLVAAIGHVFRLDGAVCKIHVTPKPLHFRKQFVVPPRVDFNTAEVTRYSGPGRRRKDYKARLSPVSGKYHLTFYLRFVFRLALFPEHLQIPFREVATESITKRAHAGAPSLESAPLRPQATRSGPSALPYIRERSPIRMRGE